MTAAVPPSLVLARADFDALVKAIRPDLHRYCARMTGSVVDGEDVVQDALAKAYYALPMMTAVPNLRGWMFRIAHNAAIDHLRRSERHRAERLDDHPPLAEENPPLDQAEIATAALSLFLQLTPMQRSCVFLKDVMGHSLAEMSELHGTSVTAVKAALHRGRARLRTLSESVVDGQPPALDGSERDLLARYVDRFNARDFDTVRLMLADDVKLDLIGRAQRRGAVEVGDYYHRYGEALDWRLQLGSVDGQPAILVDDPREPTGQPGYFMLLAWRDDRVALIRDYRYARHVMRDAQACRVTDQAAHDP